MSTACTAGSGTPFPPLFLHALPVPLLPPIPAAALITGTLSAIPRGQSAPTGFLSYASPVPPVKSPMPSSPPSSSLIPPSAWASSFPSSMEGLHGVFLLSYHFVDTSAYPKAPTTGSGSALLWIQSFLWTWPAPF